jgi:AraC family transcriptional regulator of arabinose operon
MDPRIQIVNAVLENDLSGPSRIAELSRSVHLSSSRLRHLFRADTGQTIAQHRKDVRLEEARFLLRNTLLSVKEIMHRVGINSDSHFAHDFKEACGLSPTQYRSHRHEPLPIDRSVEVVATSDKE